MRSWIGDGKVVNGKRTARVHELRCAFDAAFKEVRLGQNGSVPVQFRLDDSCPDRPMARRIFRISRRICGTIADKGFPDDRKAFGPTITSEASLREIQKWFPQVTLESMRRRFRANLELSGGAAFCEDQLFGAPEELQAVSNRPREIFRPQSLPALRGAHARS